MNLANLSPAINRKLNTWRFVEEKLSLFNQTKNPGFLDHLVCCTSKLYILRRKYNCSSCWHLFSILAVVFYHASYRICSFWWSCLFQLFIFLFSVALCCQLFGLSVHASCALNYDVIPYSRVHSKAGNRNRLVATVMVAGNHQFH